MSIIVGLDILAANEFSALREHQIAVVCNQASVDQQYNHILALLRNAASKSKFKISAVFGPQHGISGTTQDNMIEWNGEGSESASYPVYSLYGDQREPTEDMLKGVDLIVVDLPDVGSRYYTFTWTMTLLMKVAERLGIPMLSLDRPNPIGSQIEGPVLDKTFASFVGLHPLPIRHGLTIGELAQVMNQNHYPSAMVDVIKLHGWDRNTYADMNGYSWVMPSPNMPTVQTAVVYPGGCLIEGTNLSEGRGTTRPFEMIGAPWLDGERLAHCLTNYNLGGVTFRSVQFEPTFNKYQRRICGGVFVHVTDRQAFEPVLTYTAIIIESIRQSGLHDSSHVKTDRFVADGGETSLQGFAWKQPPYEYEFNKLPIDILFGNDRVRGSIENGLSLEMLRNNWKSESNTFNCSVENCRLYDR